MADTLIKCEDLTLGYDKIIAENISFELKAGDYLCVVGANGAGKSTLIKSVAGLRKVTKGNIIFSDGITRKEIGFLPQQTEAQKDFPASVWEIVLSGCQTRKGLRPFYNKAERASVRENMELMGISELAKRSYRSLSGGQQQRVLLARAMCAAQKLIILDEPVTGLDPVVTEQMYSLIEKLNKKGMAVLMVSHDIRAAVKYASHILHIGETSFFGTTEEYLKSDTGRKFIETGSSAAQLQA